VDEAEGLELGAATAEASASGAEPVAVALALNGANIDPSIAEDERAFPRKQSALAEKQGALVDDQCNALPSSTCRSAKPGVSRTARLLNRSRRNRKTRT